MPTTSSYLALALQDSGDELLNEWLTSQRTASRRQLSRAEEQSLAASSREFLSLLKSALQKSGIVDPQAGDWAAVRNFLTSVSASRAKAGYSPTETATFVFSLKEPLFRRIQANYKDPQELGQGTWEVTIAIDKLGLYTAEAYQKTRDDIIGRQQQELLELSTPVVRLWDGILALPLIGTLDSNRTQVVMQNLLEAIVSTRSDLAIIDITGVPTVDTLVAQHLLKTVAAARLMGADCIISGIRPQIAQTIIHLGVDLSAVTTKATMAEAFRVALQRTGASINAAGSAAAAAKR